MTNTNRPSWWFFTGNSENKVKDINEKLDNVSPPWRKFEEQEKRDSYRGLSFVFDHENPNDRSTLDLINAALYLHRPMLVKGDTGIGKSSLAYAIANELDLGNVIYWPITSHTSIKEGLYRYDIIRHLQSVETESTKKGGSTKKGEDDNVGRYFSLKQLGSALASPVRRVLLIDELDKADMDLPNDLLHVLEEGRFQIDELIYQTHNNQGPLPEVLMDDGDKVSVEKGGWVSCKSFPLIIITSNLEREFPPAFLRRCITIDLKRPTEKKLIKILKNHFKNFKSDDQIQKLVKDFDVVANKGSHLATDRLLSAVHVYLQTKEYDSEEDLEGLQQVINRILLDQETKGN